MKKKVLLLTASYGSGHLTANKYVENALLGLYPDEVETKSIDFLRMEVHPLMSSIFRSSYSKSMENPWLWHVFFNITNSKVVQIYFKIIMPIFYSAIYYLFEKESPDIFVATHPYWSFIVGPYRKQFKKDIPLVMIVTDSTAIHRTWIDSSIDYYVVMDNETRDVLYRLGISLKKIVVLGFPVNPELGKRIDKRKLMQELGFNPELPTLLFVIGLGAKERFVSLIDLVNEYLAHNTYQMVILAGGYKALNDALSKKKFNAETRIFGWTDKMVDLIRASDLIVSKGGGAIITEGLAAGKPMIIPVFVPGQEAGNAEYIKKYELGYVDTSSWKIVGIIKDLVSHPYKLQRLQKHVSVHSKPNASFDVARFIYSLLYP